MRRFVVLSLAAMLAWAGPVKAADLALGEGEDWVLLAHIIQTVNADMAAEADPLTASMTVCHDTACAQQTTLRLEPDEAARLRELFTPAVNNGAEERKRIARAIAAFETFVGAKNGTWRDLRRNEHPVGADEGQLDCVSEAINSRTYLERLRKAGLLAHHDIAGFVHRYEILLQHVAVELVERGTEESWVLDSWVGANGGDPLIEPWLQWRLVFDA